MPPAIARVALCARPPGDENRLFHRLRSGGGRGPGIVGRDCRAGQKHDRLGDQGPILEVFLVVGSEGHFDVLAGKHFGLRAKACHEFRGRTEGCVVQAATFFAAIALRLLNKG